MALSISNIALFLIASDSRNRVERFTCSLLFFVFAYSFKIFFTFLEGPDSNTFRGLTENLVKNQPLLPEQHDYYQWPALFVLGKIASSVLGLSVAGASELLFFAWILVFSAGLFLYTSQRDDLRDFLSMIAYGIAVYPFVLLQFSAWTFALTLFVICLNLMSRNRMAARVAALVVYTTLIFSHAFMALFLVLAASGMAIMRRSHAILALSFGLLFLFNLVFRAQMVVLDLAALPFALFLEYSYGLEVTVAEPISTIDVVAQFISRSVTLSMWSLLGLVTLSALLSKKLREIDISVGIGASIYAIAGSIFPILGWRAIGTLFLPTTRALRIFALGSRARKVLCAYFILAMAIFPFGLVHFYYDDTNYMAFREQDPIDKIFIPLYAAESGSDTRVLARTIARSYVESRSITASWWIDEGEPFQRLERGSWFHFILMSPEFEKNLVNKAGFSEDQLSGLRTSLLSFSRIYSNGHVVVLQNSNVTSPPDIHE